MESRSPHGERGLKYPLPGLRRTLESRSPHGERGLKYARLRRLSMLEMVAPPTGSVD